MCKYLFADKVDKEQAVPTADEIAAIMLHEIGHATLGHGGKEDKWDRETHEVQAESIAYWVSGMLNLDTSDYSLNP